MKGSLEYDPYSQAPKISDGTCPAHLPDYQFCDPQHLPLLCWKDSRIEDLLGKHQQNGRVSPGAAASCLQQKCFPKFRDNTTGTH